MLKNQLLAEVSAPAEHLDLAWRQDEGGAWVALRITSNGLRAMGAEAEETSRGARADCGGRSGGA
jgi:hypothetical protein